MLSNQQIAAVFANIADSMELLGEDRFKYQAYRRASETLAALSVSIQDYHARGALKEIPGVGAAISSKIVELLDTGSLGFYERLRDKVPDGVVDVMRVPGIGPKTAWRLYQELGVSDIEELDAALGAGKISTLKGLGAKMETASERVCKSRLPRASGSCWARHCHWRRRSSPPIVSCCPTSLMCLCRFDTPLLPDHRRY